MIKSVSFKSKMIRGRGPLRKRKKLWIKLTISDLAACLIILVKMMIPKKKKMRALS